MSLGDGHELKVRNEQGGELPTKSTIDSKW